MRHGADPPVVAVWIFGDPARFVRGKIPLSRAETLSTAALARQRGEESFPGGRHGRSLLPGTTAFETRKLLIDRSSD
jgi:hypothetical protein